MNSGRLTPVRIAYAVASLPIRLWKWLYCRRLRYFCRADSSATLTSEATIHNPFGRDAVKIGARTLFMGEVIMINANSSVAIGDWSFVGPGTKMWAMDRIEIGSRVQISHGVHILDNNSHSRSAAERHAGFQGLQMGAKELRHEQVSSRPVRIEDDVWIGFNAAIMKGVTVGRGAIVGACAVVIRDVPAYTIVAGNPASVVGTSEP